MAALNPTELKYDVGFDKATRHRHRRHHDEILRALLEDILALYLQLQGLVLVRRVNHLGSKAAQRPDLPVQRNHRS